MKKIVATIFTIMMLQGGYFSVNALQIDDRPEPGMKSDCDWVNFRQTERDAKINYYRKIVFKKGTDAPIDKNEFKKQYRGRLADMKTDKHYTLLNNNIDITKENYLVGHYKKYTDADVMQTYSIQPRKDILHVYRYHANGNLAYMDYIIGHYPRFPYMSKQYNPNGKLNYITYYKDVDTRYIYNGKGKFKGYWYKGKKYSRRGNVMLF